MKTKFTLMTAFATVVLAGAAFTANAQCGYNGGYAPARGYAPGYGYAPHAVIVNDRRDIYHDQAAIDREKVDLYRDHVYGNRFDAYVDHRRLDRDYHELGHDRRDLRHDRW